MFTFEKYMTAGSLEEAFEMNKGKRNVVMGGNLWLKMGSKNYSCAIDLSGLGLDKIEETDEGFEIGCMTSLRDIEMHKGLDSAFSGSIREALRHIVGVQFRNTATLGGSLYPRFGFSDVLTIFACLDTTVRLYGRGDVPIEEFIEQTPGNDILTGVYIRKDGRRVSYRSHRMSETDFAVLTCAASCLDGKYTAVFGARPQKACIVHPEGNDISGIAEDAVSRVHFGSNMRAGAQYRQEIAGVLLRRALADIQGEE